MINKTLKEQKLRKQKIAQFIKIGELAEKTGIDQLATEILIGAFQMIAQTPQNHSEWHKIGGTLLKDSNTIVFMSVQDKPNSDVINKLRSLKFYFDPFHKRFFGPARNKAQAEGIIGVI